MQNEVATQNQAELIELGICSACHEAIEVGWLYDCEEYERMFCPSCVCTDCMPEPNLEEILPLANEAIFEVVDKFEAIKNPICVIMIIDEDGELFYVSPNHDSLFTGQATIDRSAKHQVIPCIAKSLERGATVARESDTPQLHKIGNWTAHMVGFTHVSKTATYLGYTYLAVLFTNPNADGQA